MAVDATEIQSKSAAYHESAHIIVACVHGLPINPKGICITNFASGRALFRGASDGIAVSPSEVDKVVIALFAGGIAQARISGGMQDACAGDNARIQELLEAHYPDAEERKVKRDLLLACAREAVQENWVLIEKTAERLWSKPWQSKNLHHPWPQEKRLSAEELASLVDPLVISIDETAE